MVDSFSETISILGLVDENSAWQRERHQLVRLLLLLTALISTFGLIYAWQIGFFAAAFPGRIFGALLALIGLWVLVIFANSLPYAPQALTFLVLVYVLGFLDLNAVGFIGHGPMLLFLCVILSFALFNLRISLFAMMVSTLTLAGIGWAGSNGRIVFDIGAQMSVILIPNPTVEILRFGGILFLLTFFSYRIVVTAQQALQEQAVLTEEYGNERREVAERVDERTRALSTSSEISRLLSAVRDQRQIQMALVNLVQKAFDYYHVQLYVVDDGQHVLRLVAATGVAGKLLIAQQHSLGIGVGIVGKVAASAEMIFKPYVALSQTWRPNPLLPYTRAEVAVPMFLDGKVWGVLDVQHDRAGGLTAEDTDFLESVTNQMTVALGNIRRYEAAQSRAEREALFNQIAYKIQLAPDPDALLKVVTRELARGLKVNRVAMQVDRWDFVDGLDEASAEVEPQ